MFGTVGNSTKCEGDHQWKEMRTGNLIFKKTEIVKVLKKIMLDDVSVQEFPMMSVEVLKLD